MKKNILGIVSAMGCLLSASVIAVSVVIAEESAGEKARETISETKKETKKVYRSAKDKACEMVNGKLQCAGDKVKHKIENLKDEVESN